MRATEAEVTLLSQLGPVQAAFQVLHQVTGLRIALVARVTKDTWTACAVSDQAGYGIKPGDVLEIDTTY